MYHEDLNQNAIISRYKWKNDLPLGIIEIINFKVCKYFRIYERYSMWFYPDENQVLEWIGKRKDK